MPWWEREPHHRAGFLVRGPGQKGSQLLLLGRGPGSRVPEHQGFGRNHQHAVKWKAQLLRQYQMNLKAQLLWQDQMKWKAQLLRQDQMKWKAQLLRQDQMKWKAQLLQQDQMQFVPTTHLSYVKAFPEWKVYQG